MRRGAQDPHVFLGKLRAGNGEELLFELKLGGGIAEAGDRIRRAAGRLYTLSEARQRQQSAQQRTYP
jgi:hypothetical protein